MRKNFKDKGLNTHNWIKSSILVLCEKIKHRCPPFCNCGSSTERTRNLQDNSAAPCTEPGTKDLSLANPSRHSSAGCDSCSPMESSPCPAGALPLTSTDHAGPCPVADLPACTALDFHSSNSAS